MRACYFDFYWGLPQPLLTLNYIGVRSQLENQRKCNVRHTTFPMTNAKIRKIRIIRVQKHPTPTSAPHRACEKNCEI